jgi:hypothetical protein
MPAPTITRSQALGRARELKNEFFASMLPAAAAAAGVQESSASSLAALPANILGVGFGAKQTSGASSAEEMSLRVYVRAKVPRKDLSAAELVPSTLNGTPTDVVPVGDIIAGVRPTQCGVSVGHHRITAGTLGCLVRRIDGSPARFILSNNHVLADSNQGSVGDDVLEPGPMDGGDPTNPIARLTDFEQLDFSGPNSMDAAIAEVIQLPDILREITIIGAVQQPTGSPAVYQSVRKHGRTTLHTVGVIMDVAADVKVRYGNRIAAFEDQIAIEGVGGFFGQGGDSGSLIVDAVKRTPVGLLFAVGGGTTFANYIEPVLDRFQIEIV